MNENKNLVITIALCSIILFLWQYFFEIPKAQNLNDKATITDKSDLVKPQNNLSESIDFDINQRDQNITTGERIKIATSKLHGSILLKGARFDDLTLAKYHETIDNSSEVTLLSPARTKQAYFAEFGFLSNSDIKLPDVNTVWQADHQTLTEYNPINLTWNNQEGLIFNIKVAVDKHYMFTITQSVINNSAKQISFMPYGLISQLYQEEKKQNFFILHEGLIGVFNGKLEELAYKSLKKSQKVEHNDNKGWLGITDKYWLTALIPNKDITFNSRFLHAKHVATDRFQADYLGSSLTVNPGDKNLITNHFFAGAKEISLLDKYTTQFDIPLFDRAVDFGWFYFLTKPMLGIIKYFYSLFGNFGLAILTITIIVKLVMFPLANKSYISMHKMKLLNPEVEKIKASYKDDKLQMNKAIMDLYSKQKVNPLSGCLPVFLQIPVFFSLYKVLFVTIEMRHAPFFAWIKDLSAPDPTSIFNLFGLLPFTPPAFLSIGFWPLLMGVTMYLQQRMNPEPSDPVQAKLMKFLPVIFVFMFKNFPAGLVIYWAWNNILSILQQWFITRSVNKR